MACYKLTYDYQPTLFLQEQGEKIDTVKWAVWSEVSTTFSDGEVKVLTQGDPNDINRRFGASFDQIYKERLKNTMWDGQGDTNQDYMERAALKIIMRIGNVQLEDVDKQYFMRPLSYEITVTNPSGGLMSTSTGEIDDRAGWSMDPIYPNPGYLLTDTTATPLSYPLGNGNTINITIYFQRSNPF